MNHKNFYLKCALLLLVQYCVFCGPLKAQEKNISSDGQLWTAYFNQARFSDKWGMWTDVQLRTRESLVKNLSVSILRTGLTYYVNDNVKLTNGIAYINHFPSPPGQEISLPEFRLWQQVQWHHNFPKVKLMHYLRLEERWRKGLSTANEAADGFNYATRVRYNFLFQFALSRKKFAPGSISGVLNNELHTNLGKKVVYNVFDQNRFFAGISYQLKPTTNLQLGYMNVFIQQGAVNRFRNLNTVRLFLLQNIDFR